MWVMTRRQLEILRSFLISQGSQWWRRAPQAKNAGNYVIEPPRGQGEMKTSQKRQQKQNL